MSGAPGQAWPGLQGWAGPVVPVPAPSLRHLGALSGPHGLYEHSSGHRPRPELGCCTDDAGRALALACRLPGDPHAEGLARLALGFLERAHVGDGQFLLRLGADGHWTEDPPSDDAAGRALLGLGVGAASAPWEDVRQRSVALFSAAASFRSSFVRATAYAVLGAAEISKVADGAELRAARRMLADAAAALSGLLGDGAGALGDKTLAPKTTGQAGPDLPSGRWRWPEERLRYANALVPAGALAAGRALGQEGLVEAGLGLLAWLVDLESTGGRFSFTPTGGRAPGGPQPSFDQQPIEAGAMAFACARALALSGDDSWAVPFWAAVEWWLGRNDHRAVVFDPATGGSYDGLTPQGVNSNQGAESTIAFVGTMALAAEIAKRPSQALAAKASSSSGTEAVAAPT